ncbi:MAG: phosphotransferase [Pseudonocardia sp.]
MEISERARAAAATAAAAGRALGLTVDEPRVLHDVFSVVVHLAPAPVVVRAPTVLPPTIRADPQGQAAQQRAEVAVARWLAQRGHPVVAPSPLVAEQPVRRDGLSMTFWTFVQQVDGSTMQDASRGALAARLHAALRGYDGELAWLPPLDDYVPAGIEELTPAVAGPEVIERARRDWAQLAPLASSPEAFARAFPLSRPQPIHGDSPLYNVIPTADGDLCSDFEHVGLGPVEWDLTFASPEQLTTYDATAAAAGLAPHDPRLLAVMASARMLQLVAYLPVAPEIPGMLDAMRPAVEEWLTRPVAGGLEGNP